MEVLAKEDIQWQVVIDHFAHGDERGAAIRGHSRFKLQTGCITLAHCRRRYWGDGEANWQ
jgi:hypothetical protein